jgi:tetratricopeptide (TPR) repeat protein
MKGLLNSVALVLLLVVAGCATTEEPTGTSASVGERASAIAPKDMVLWQYRDGVSHLRNGEFADAKRLLDAAITTISGIRANDKSAKQSRGYFHRESKKTFLGEPYERVMAYYYRGILYWMDGEPDNARACFRSAQLEDSDAEEHSFASDYVLLDYLDGFASTKLSQDGADAYQRACKLAKGLKLPPYDAQANVLVFIEYGNGPEKYATGEYGEELRFRERPSSLRNAVVKVDRNEASAPPYDDLAFQARTRGGRVMDHVLANKAVFKTATDIAGDVGIIGGLVLSQGRDTRDAGIGLALAGALSKGISALTTPQADTRCWDNLPQYLSFAALKLPPGDHEVKVEFEDAKGNLLPQYTRRVNLHIPAGARDSVIFVSDKSADSQNQKF